MSSLDEKVRAEVQVREFLENNGLRQPDAIEYGHQCIRLFYNEEKVVLIVDLE